MKNAYFTQIGLNLRQFFKSFSAFLASRANLFVFSASPSLKTAIFTHKSFIFIFNLHSNFKKRYEFSLIFTLFQVYSPSFLGCVVYVDILIYGWWIWVFDVFVEIDLWVLLRLIIWWLFYMFNMFILYAYALCYDLYCVVHTMLVIKYLLDVFVCIFGLHWVQKFWR